MGRRLWGRSLKVRLGWSRRTRWRVACLETRLAKRPKACSCLASTEMLVPPRRALSMFLSLCIPPFCDFLPSLCVPGGPRPPAGRLFYSPYLGERLWAWVSRGTRGRTSARGHEERNLEPRCSSTTILRSSARPVVNWWRSSENCKPSPRRFQLSGECACCAAVI